MKEKTKVSAKCRWCGTCLPLNHVGVCPKCGKKGKHISAVVSEVIALDESIQALKKTKYKKIELLITSITSLISFIGAALSLTLFAKAKLNLWILLIVLLISVAIGSGFYLYNWRKKNKQLRIEKLKVIEKDFFKSIDDSINSMLEGRL